MSRLPPSGVLIVLVLLTSLPFLNQAFHIDDRIYLEIADNILEQPLFPYDYPTVFEGLVSPDAASHSHLPLVSYYLALIQWTGNEKEWVFHLAFLVFPILAVWGFYELAGSFVRHRLAAASLLALSPGFFVLSHTLMPEVALLAAWVVTLGHFLKMVQGRAARRDWIICGLALAGAALMSLLSVGLLLLMLVCWWWTPRRQVSGWVLLAFLAIPLLLWSLWFLRAYLHYDRLVLINLWGHMRQREAFSVQNAGLKSLSLVLNLGGVFIFPPALWYALAGPISGRLLSLISLLCLVPFHLGVSVWSGSQKMLFAVFLGSGLLVMVAAVKSFRMITRKTPKADSEKGLSEPEVRPFHPAPSSSWVLVICWFWGVTAICIFAAYSGSVRYSLLAAPAVILFWIRSLEIRIKAGYLRRNLVGLGILVTGVYSFALAQADFQFAEVYRKAAREIQADYGGPGRTVWFAGEWGFRYYLEKEGARILTRTSTQAQPNDILVKPYLATPWITVYDSPEYLTLLERREARVKSPLRILDFSSHAGFYSTGWGILPFSASAGEPWEWFDIDLVRKEFRGLVPEQGRHW